MGIFTIDLLSGTVLLLTGNFGSSGSTFTVTKAITTSGGTRFDFPFSNTVSDYDYIWSWADGQIIPVAFSDKDLTGITVTPEADGILTIHAYSK